MRAASLFVLAALLVGCKESAPVPASSPSTEASIPFRIDGSLSFVRGADTLRTIDIEIAADDSSRARGLMQRSVIPGDTGMLFIFPRAEPQAFYMANTPRPLDIQFYAADSTLLNTVENTVPYSLDNVLSEGAAQYVVEVPAGVTRRIGLVPGDRITWTTD